MVLSDDHYEVVEKVVMMGIYENMSVIIVTYILLRFSSDHLKAFSKY